MAPVRVLNYQNEEGPGGMFVTIAELSDGRTLTVSWALGSTIIGRSKWEAVDLTDEELATLEKLDAERTGRTDKIIPGEIIGRRIDKDVTDEAEHFMVCPVCGVAFDMRDLGQVALHIDDDHEAPKRD